MTERLVAIGLNHHSAPVELRERVAFDDEETMRALLDLQGTTEEAFVLSTCNRTELFAVSSAPDAATRLVEFVADRRSVPASELLEHGYAWDGEEAVRHLLRVASGIESMVLGESQILGQVRAAHGAAMEAGSIGRTLGRLLPLALEIGKRSRTETAIGRGFLSPSSVAVDLVRRLLGSLEDLCVLVIGAGESGEAALRALAEAGVRDLIVANRSIGRAEATAVQVGGRTIPWGELERGLAQADIVIASTGATSWVVTAELLERVMTQRPQRPLLCIDIAVPRDVEPAVGDLPGVHLHNIDNLEAVVARNREGRDREVAAVEQIIEEGVAEYREWSSAQQIVPTIGALYQRAEAIRRLEVDRTVRRLSGLTNEERDLIDVMTSAIVRRLLHGPVAALRARGADPDVGQLARYVQELFELPVDELETAGTP